MHMKNGTKIYLAITLGVLSVPFFSYATNLAEDIYTAEYKNIRKAMTIPVLIVDKTNKNVSAFIDPIYGTICYQIKDSISCVKL